MNPFDSTIVTFLNGFAGHSRLIDGIVSGLVSNPLLKGGVIVSLIWWAWFSPKSRSNSDNSSGRELLLSGLVAGVLSIAVARGLALTLPFRERPIRNPDLHFHIPFGTDPDTLIRWSSFPSDHAALFFALSVSLFLVSRRVGIFALLYSFFIICLPRTYIGVHYPTDLLAGMAIGSAITYLVSLPALRIRFARPCLQLSEKSPGVFYAVFFLFTFQVAMNFDQVRYLAHGVIGLFSGGP